MKPTYYACCILSVLLFFFVCCKKDPTKNAELPAATQEGRNTAGFSINGEVVIPYAKCGSWVGECRALRADTFTNPYYSPNKQIEFSILRETKNSYVSLHVSVNFPKTAGSKIDSISADINCRNVGGVTGLYYGPIIPRSGSKFIITKIDTVNEIISGEFELELVSQETRGKITIKDGSFDLHLNTCVCSN